MAGCSGLLAALAMRRSEIFTTLSYPPFLAHEAPRAHAWDASVGSNSELSPVHGKNDARNILRSFRGQVNHGSLQFLRVTVSAHGD